MRPPVVVVNASPPHGGRYDQAVEAIKKMGLAVCPASLGYRVAFEYAAQLGQSAAEYEPGGKAAEEIEAVYKCNSSTRRHAYTPREKHEGKST